MSGIETYLARTLKDLRPDNWDAFVRYMDQRFRVLEEQLGIEKRVTESILQRGLQVIEDGIGPSIASAQFLAQTIADIAHLGTLFTTTSTTSVAIANSGNVTFIVPEAERLRFAPGEWLAATVDPDHWMVGQRVSYNSMTGALVISVLLNKGSGTFADWTISQTALPAVADVPVEALGLVDSISADFDGVETEFLLRKEGTPILPATPAMLLVTINHVVQPPSSYSVDDDKIVFSEAPAEDDECTILAFGQQVSIGAPDNGTVTWAKLAVALQNIIDAKLEQGDLDTAINNLKAGAGTALDTLNELATALGNDANFAATMTTALANRVRVDAGQALTATQQQTARANILSAPIAALADRNMLLNGEHRVSQENADNTVSTNSLYVDDQWWLIFGGGCAGNARRMTSAGPPGYLNFFRLTVTTPSAVGWFSAVQPVEAIRLSPLALGTGNARPSKIGFWARASVVVASCSVEIKDSAGVLMSAPLFSINAANTWEFKVVDVPAYAAGTWATGGVIGATIFIHPGVALKNTNGATFDFTGAFWLPGTDAPNADTVWAMQRSNEEELRMCQRYYEICAGHFGGAQNQTQRGIIKFSVRKRAAPTLSFQNLRVYTGSAWVVPDTTSIVGVSVEAAFIGAQHSVPFFLVGSNTANGGGSFETFGLIANARM